MCIYTCVCAHMMLGAKKNAVAKLNLLFRDRVHFCDLAEMPVGQTSFTAFTVAVSVDGRHHVGVGKTKKAARNAAAERALKFLRLWTRDDDSVKYAATMEVDEDPVATVYRMRDVIAQERDLHSLEHGGGGWNKAQRPQSWWNPEIRGGFARGRGDRNGGWGGDHGWGGEPRTGPYGPDEWDDFGPDTWNQPGHGSYFNDRRGRPDVPGGRGFRGGFASEPFRRNTDTLNTRGSCGWDTWNRGGRGSRGRADSGMMRFEKPSFQPSSASKVSSLSSRLTSETSSSSLMNPLSLFSSNPNPLSVSPWSFAFDPTNHNQAGVQPAAQAPASYVPSGADFYAGDLPYENVTPDMTYAHAADPAGGYMQPGSGAQNISQTNTLLMYGGSGYDSMYGQGAYSSY